MKPYVVIHNAVSADGRIDWFTPDIGLFYKLISTWQEDATLAGCDTLLNPPEEVPPETEEDLVPPAPVPDDPRPILVVPDSRGRLSNWHFLRRQPYWKDFIALCSKTTPKRYLEYLEERQIRYIVAGEDHVDLKKALNKLNQEYAVKVVRVDSGGTLNGALLRLGLVDEVSLLIHPTLVGGTSAKSSFRAPDLSSPKGVTQLRLKSAERLDNDILWLRYDVVR